MPWTRGSVCGRARESLSARRKRHNAQAMLPTRGRHVGVSSARTCLGLGRFREVVHEAAGLRTSSMRLKRTGARPSAAIRSAITWPAPRLIIIPSVPNRAAT